jgi:hypothetical protein
MTAAKGKYFHSLLSNAADSSKSIATPPIPRNVAAKVATPANADIARSRSILQRGIALFALSVPSKLTRFDRGQILALLDVQ